MQGWKEGTLDLQAFRGQTIKLRFRTDPNQAIPGLARIDNVVLQTVVPGWSVSNSSAVRVDTLGFPESSATSIANANFGRDGYTYTDLPSLRQVGFGTALDPTTYPANYDFHNGIADWQISNTATVQVVDCPYSSNNEKCLWINQDNQSATSAAFQVPMHAQSLHFRYQVYASGDPAALVPLEVSILNGSTRSVATTTPLRGSYLKHFQFGVVDIQAFQGQTIQVRFKTPNRAFISGMSLYNQVDGWTLSNARNVYGDDTEQMEVHNEIEPANMTFADSNQAFADVTASHNLDFATGLAGWSTTSSAQLTLENNYGHGDGNYVRMAAANLQATSPAFTVPDDAQRLLFFYMTWLLTNDPNGTTPVNVYVDLLTGPDFSIVRSSIETYAGSLSQGWRTGTIDLQLYQGEAIKLRFRSQSGAKIDTLTLDAPVPAWQLSNAKTVSISNQVLTMNGADQSVTSSAFEIDEPIQAVQFTYTAANPSNANEQRRIRVEALSGVPYEVITNLNPTNTVKASQNQACNLPPSISARFVAVQFGSVFGRKAAAL